MPACCATRPRLRLVRGHDPDERPPRLTRQDGDMVDGTREPARLCAECQRVRLTDETLGSAE